MADKIQNAYRESKDIYDRILTQAGFLSKLYNRLFWSGTDDNEIAGKLLSAIPDSFSGKLLDVPAGTAIFTYQKWLSLKHAEIICLDYSADMIAQARERLKDSPWVTCIRGDVGKLPLENECCDIVLSMNGFHAFPDKDKAFSETWRVLKPGGKFIACFYIRGRCRRTDWLVRHVLAKKGWFTPPFQTQEQLKSKLNGLYSKLDFHIDGSIVYFFAVK